MIRSRHWILRRSVPGAVVLVALAAATFVHAQDGLYAPAPPGDAALVRVVNLLPDDSSPRIDAGPVRFPPLPPGEAGPYRPVPTGVYLLGGRQEGVLFSPQPETFVTIVIGPRGTLEPVVDEAHTDPVRAQLVLYNYTDTAVDLRSLQPAGTIFSAVEPSSAVVRALNAVTVDLAVDRHSESSAVEEADGALFRREVSLERGQSYGVFVTEWGSFLHRAHVAP